MAMTDETRANLAAAALVLARLASACKDGADHVGFVHDDDATMHNVASTEILTRVQDLSDFINAEGKYRDWRYRASNIEVCRCQNTEVCERCTDYQGNPQH